MIGSGTPAYQGEYISQNFVNSMYAGATQQANITIRNTGTATWDGNTKLAPAPRDVASPFYDPATWQGSTRIASAGPVAPGATKTFTFNLKAPAQPGTYHIPFAFVQEGLTWFSSPPDGYIWFQITVLASPLPAAPSNVGIYARTQSSLTLSWSDNATNEQGYRIYRWNGSTWPLIATLGPGATSYTNSGLNYPFGYTYLVAAFNAAGEHGVRVDGYIANAMSDLNNDGYSDILWRHAASGRNSVYLMRSTTIASVTNLTTIGNLTWKVAGVGDFNADGYADILWRNTSTGVNAIHFMRGATFLGSSTINSVPSPDWQVAAVGDTDNNGRADILWRNMRSGLNVLYRMDGAQIVSSITLNTASLDWKIVGFDDFNFDTRADILWRNTSTGQNVLHFMGAAGIASTSAINTVANPDWMVAGTGDYNGDGRADILWRNTSTGQNVIYLMNGGQILHSGGVNTVSTSWMVAGAGDYNGDGKADILWRNTSTGQNVIYLMSGATIVRSDDVNTVADPLWKIVGKGSNAAAGVGQGLASADEGLWPASSDGQAMELATGGDSAEMQATEAGAIMGMQAAASSAADAMQAREAGGMLGPNDEPSITPPAGETPLPEPTSADLPPGVEVVEAMRLFLPLVVTLER